MKSPRNPATVHQPVAGYTHQIEVTGPVRWLVLSGQIGLRTNGTLPDDPIEQMKTALNNVRHNLEAAALAISDIVKLTIYLVGEIDTQRRRATLAAWLDGHQPCMTLLYVAALAAPGYRVEVDAWACHEITK